MASAVAESAVERKMLVRRESVRLKAHGRARRRGRRNVGDLDRVRAEFVAGGLERGAKLELELSSTGVADPC